MAKIKLFNKGDVILTNPEDGFWGIAVVLSEREKTADFYPMCHIAITPIILDQRINFSEINTNDLKPLEFEQVYAINNIPEFTRTETCIKVYTRRNKHDLEVIGKINPEITYNGPLPFEPLSNLEITWPLCGETDNTLGREAYITWKRKNN